MPDGFIHRMGLQAVLDLKEFRQNAQIYDQSLKKMQRQTEQTVKQSEKAAATVSKSWEAGFAKVAVAATAAVASLLAVRKATQFLAQATQLAARVETLGVSLATVGQNAGYSAEQIAGFEEAVKAQGITTRAARQSLLQMGQAQIDFTHAADLARIAQDAAVIANTNSSEAFQRLTWVISTGSVRMARTLGLQVSFQRGYEQMATQIGKTTEELTEQERVQARTNVIMQAGAQIAGTYEAAMGTAGKQALSLARHIEEITVAIGQVGLGAFSVGIQELTRLLKELQKWIEENEQELDALGESVTMLVEAMTDFADLELPLDSLTAFVENMTTLVSVLSVGIEVVSDFRKENEALFAVFDALNKVAVWPVTVAEKGLSALTEFRKENEALFLTEQQIAENISKFREPWIERAEEEAVAREKLAAARAAEIAAMEEQMQKDAAIREEMAENIQKYLDRVADMQRAHERKLTDMAADFQIKQERAWAKYEKSVAREITKGEARIAKLGEAYNKRRVKTIADYEKRVVEAEAEVSKARIKAQKDFEKRERQARERFRLDSIQSERRYQFERARLVAEGDTLAIEELDARYKLEQEETKENEALRQKQSREGQAEQIREAGEAAREQIDELRQQLAETLDEQEASYLEQVEAQKRANQDRLAEIHIAYAEQQALADEDYQRSIEKANLNYQRQEEDLGRHLARDEELQDLSGREIESILEQYYGPGGTTREIMEGYYEWLESRAIASAVTVAAAQAGPVELGGLMPGGFPATGYGVGMQEGGILRGPAMAYVEPGVTEAFVPLTGPGAGGAFTHEFMNALNITGLEGASQADVSRIARELAVSLTQKIRSRRRH